MKLNPAERHLYTILAERAEMTLDEWIQSLPRQQLAQLEAEDLDDYQALMLDFAQHMLAGGADSPNASTKKEANWHVCPACKQKKYASAYPGETEICRMCTRKQAEESEPAALPDPEEAKKPDPNDPRYKTCDRCGRAQIQDKVFGPSRAPASCARKRRQTPRPSPRSLSHHQLNSRTKNTKGHAGLVNGAAKPQRRASAVPAWISARSASRR